MKSAMATLSAFLLYTAVSAGQGATLSPEEAQQGFVSLFDGKTLTGWVQAVKTDEPTYVVEDGALVCVAKKGGIFRTEKEYSNFVFRFEFKVPPGGNNGVGIRLPDVTSRTAYEGMELQIIDDSAEKYKNLKPYQYHGSIYGMVPAKRGSLKPPGEWNSQEVVCDGPKVKVTVNGQVIVDADLSQITEPTMDGRDHPGRKRTVGYLGFLGHGSRVEFRNLRITEL